MNKFCGLPSLPRAKVSLAVSMLLVLTLPAVGKSFSPQRNPFQETMQPGPRYFWPNNQVQSLPSVQNLPPGSTTRILPDGRIAIITPFTEQQKREVARRKAERIRIRQIRTLELAKQGENDSLYPRLPGEFEKPTAILLSMSDWRTHNLEVLIDLLNKTKGLTEILLLYNEKNASVDKAQFSELIKRMSSNGKDYPHVRFLNSNLDTIWLRDFGPQLAETKDGHAMVLDFFYDTIRPNDDKFPQVWANMTGATHNQVPWSLQGGNLLANGRGLAITTTRLFEENRIKRPSKDFRQNEVYVKQQLMRFCNIKELVVLRPLEDESTRHVDMFATFLAPDLALIAKLDPRFDPQNARILDDNAQLLSQISVGEKPLRVARVWIPPRRHQHWSSYTNIVLTDRLVLIPTYQSDPPGYVREAINTYRRLLPKHVVKTIDLTSLDRLGGSLHCLSCTIPSFAKLPTNSMTFREAVKKME